MGRATAVLAVLVVCTLLLLAAEYGAGDYKSPSPRRLKGGTRTSSVRTRTSPCALIVVGVRVESRKGAWARLWLVCGAIVVLSLAATGPALKLGGVRSQGSTGGKTQTEARHKVRPSATDYHRGAMQSGWLGVGASADQLTRTQALQRSWGHLLAAAARGKSEVVV